MDNQLLRKKTFNSRINRLIKSRTYLSSSGSSINGVMPGWLLLLERALKEADELSSDQVNFFKAFERNNTMVLYADVNAAAGVGRIHALQEELRYIAQQTKSVCRYCGVTVPSQGVCNTHRTISSGRFVEDIKGMEAYTAAEFFEEETEWMNSEEVLSDAVELLKVLADAPKSEEVAVAVGSLRVLFIGQNKYSSRSRYLEKKQEYLETLDDAIKAKLITTSPVEPLEESSAPSLKVFDDADLEEVWKRSSASGERKKILEPFYTKMKELGGLRPYAQVPHNYEILLHDLQNDFPNFSAVVEFVRTQFALAALGDGRVFLPPFDLDGDPGVGKTFFVKSLTKLIETQYLEIHMESQQNAADISGSSTFWSNTQPGRVFTTLATGKTCSPVVLVDELDKAMNRFDGGYDPVSGLYQLLEPVTAKTFCDQSFSVRMDASAINWIFTSNKVDTIPAPILSRLKVFSIPKPNQEQTRHITKRIYKALLKDNLWGNQFDEEIHDSVTDVLSKLQPRVIRNVLLSAFGAAAISKRRYLLPEDIKKVGASGSVKMDGIGFLHASLKH